MMNFGELGLTVLIDHLSILLKKVDPIPVKGYPYGSAASFPTK